MNDEAAEIVWDWCRKHDMEINPEQRTARITRGKTLLQLSEGGFWCVRFGSGDFRIEVRDYVDADNVRVVREHLVFERADGTNVSLRSHK